MNAKISITIPIEKIHLKVSNLLEEVASEFDTTSVDITAITKSVLNKDDLLLQLDNIDLVRKKLILLDANLQDCYDILNGLVKYKMQGEEQENVEPPTK